MNIAMVSLGFAPLRTAGLDIVGERLVKGLLDRGHHVTVIAGRRGGLSESMTHGNLEIVRIPLGKTHWLGFGLRSALALRSLKSQRDFDVIHFWDVYFAWAFREKFLGSLNHSFDQRIRTSKNVGVTKKSYYRLSMFFAEKPSVRRASGLLAISRASMQEYINKYGVPDSKIVLTRLGIDTQFFRPISHVDKLRISLQIPLEDPVILYSGFFTHRKGLEYLGRAMTKIHPTPWLVLTGKWDLSVHQKFYASLGSMSSRVIEAGFVPDERMPDYYSMADLYVSPSLLEGFGLPLIEALSCGTPVVGVDSGAVAEVVGPGGVLVPPADSQALAQAVSCLLSSPMKRKNLARQGRAHVVTNFGLERMVDTYIEAYKHFLYALSS